MCTIFAEFKQQEERVLLGLVKFCRAVPCRSHCCGCCWVSIATRTFVLIKANTALLIQAINNKHMHEATDIIYPSCFFFFLWRNYHRHHRFMSIMKLGFGMPDSLVT